MILDKIFKNEKGEFISLIDVVLKSEDTDNYIYTLAEAHAIDLIARTIAKCELQTFEVKDKKIQETKGELYWTLNIQPNYNENGTSFLYKLTTKLLSEGSALVLINKLQKSNLLYIADSYNASDKVLKEKTFTNVNVSDSEGNSMTLSKTYSSEDTIYYSLKNQKIATASSNFKNNMAKILKATQKSYIKSNTATWRLKFPGGQPKLKDAETGQEMDYSEYKKKITDGLFSEEEAIVLLSEAFDLINLNKENDKRITDYESVIKNISDAVAQKWNIPLDIFYGNKTEKSTSNNDFITFAVDIYFEVLEDGFNISLVGKESYLKGEYVKFNRYSITHRDILESATGIDKLTANKFSRNEVNKFLKLPHIDEDWADEHDLTKNYANVEGGVTENGR